MNSVNYKLLKLPINPIRDSFDLDPLISGIGLHQQLQFSPKEMLKDEVLQIFESHNLKAQRVVSFILSSPRLLSNALMHTDVEPIPDLQWRKVIYGVNWELNDIPSYLSWYTTTRTPAYPPDDKHPLTSFYPYGIHYGHRFKLGYFPEQDNVIERVNTNIGPLLIRTDIPHTAEVEESQSKFRVAISVRFENIVHSWDEAVQLFSPLIYNGT
jgi:hypothetical protein